MVKARVVVLGCNFSGLILARYLHEKVNGLATIAVIDRKNFVNFIPNIPIEVFNNRNSADHLELNFIPFLDADGTAFI